MRRKLLILLIIFTTFLLQTTLCPAIAFASVTPNLLMILTSGFGFMRGKKTGLEVGFVCGLLLDLTYGTLVGYYALLYMLVGYMNGFFCKVFFDEKIVVPMFVVGFSDLVYSVLFFITQIFFRVRLDFFQYLSHIIIPEILYTMLVSALAYRLLYLINKKMTQYELEEQESPWLIK